MAVLLPYVNTMTAGLIAILFFAFYYVVKRSTRTKKLEPPKAAGGWPILGHLPLLSGNRPAFLTLGNLADKYGPIYSIQLGRQQAVVVSSKEMARELFTTNDLAVSDRPELTATKHLGYNGVMFAIGRYSEYWREMRKMIMVELLSSRQVELLKPVRVSETRTFVKVLFKFWEENKNGAGHVLVNLNQWFGDMSLNMLTGVVVGKRYFGTTAESDRNAAERCKEGLRGFFHYLGLFVLGDAIPSLGWLDVGGHVKGMKKTAKDLNDLASEWLEEHYRTRASGETVKNHEQDLMGIMLSVLEGVNFSGHDTDMINKSTCVNLIAGGSDTSSIILVWIISLLLNHQDCLKMAQEELDMFVGRERLVDESDVRKLVYIQAIVKETLRLYPPAPLLGPREMREDCILGGYHIKKGTRVLPNVWKIQTDPNVWPDPLEFKPERFLTSPNKDIDVRGQHMELLPFGSGRRACPGASLAMPMLNLSLATFLQCFEISNPTDAPIDLTGGVGLNFAKASPLDVIVSPRLSPEIYHME
ncbi:cytochrome P450, putative [Ricinus communis]|uniref:Cytochrome P450, putative n=1 Tax=Ricinus communis TaxID=3988 RepID=B9R7L3_RICCO|nr:cytochrome P450, putative [Ricinus communis]|eukprot:XP_002510306.1 cytochrome P450 CYP82D47 [Ricinus communis]